MKQIGSTHGIAAIIAVALVSSSSGAAQAAELALGTSAGPSRSDDSPSSESIEGEIIVTAQKRAQRLNDVGISIVAQTTEQLQSAGVTDVADLGKVAPGFNSTQSNNGFNVFSIRGVNFSSNQISASPTVSTYVDEAALPYPAMTAAMLLDVERIEVLKGPQGTLFGQNATGGSINVIAAKPTSTLKGGFRGEVNHYGQVFAEGYISGPLSDTLRARLSAQTTQFGAWQYSRYNDSKSAEANRGAARLLIDWTPSDRVRFMLNLNASYDHGKPQGLQFVKFVFQNPAGAPANAAEQLPTNDPRVADMPNGYEPRNHNRQYQAVLRGEFDVSDTLTLVSISNYIDNKTFQDANWAGTFIPINFTTWDSSAKSFGQELRLTGNLPDQKINYILGGSYQRDKPLVSDLNYHNVAYSITPPETRVRTLTRESAESIAGFGNIDWEFAEALTLTGGARYTEVKQHIKGCGISGNEPFTAIVNFISSTARNVFGERPPLVPFTAGQCLTLDDTGATPNDASFAPVLLDITSKEHNWSWRAGVNYKPNRDTLLYGLVSRGYKSGNFPVVGALYLSQIQHVAQEELTSYEIGAKASLFDRKVQVELAGFYYDYKDKQLYSYRNLPLLGAGATAVNIPKSRVKGIDFSLRAEPVTGWTINGGVTYTDSKITKGDPAEVYFDLLVVPSQIEGKSFNFAPDWSGVADTEYRFPVSASLDAYLGGGVRFASHTFSDLANSAQARIPGYAVFDARIGVESSYDWRASIWVRNLTNKLYYTNLLSQGDELVRFNGMARAFGVSFGKNF